MYIINNNTIYIKSNNVVSEVMEVDNYDVFQENGKEIIENSCIYYGSTYRGRVCSSKALLNVRYNIPIIVSEKSNIIFFPVLDGNEVVWFNFKSINRIKNVNGKVEVYFVNKKKKKFNVSYRIFNNQMAKCSRLWLNYLNRF